ncbi:MAG: triose-phosphate isomerase [Desulfomonilaceae bacterium]
MIDRKPIVAGNWKMHNNSVETRSLIQKIIQNSQELVKDCEIIIAPPFTSIACAVEEAKKSSIKIGGQNMFWEDKGAFTGEVSGPMLKEIGCSHVIIGHSERRQFFGETDETVNMKIKSAIRNELTPIFCLGETLNEREAGATLDILRKQLLQGLRDVVPANPAEFIMAYEPVWAIGTGKTATPDQAQEVHAFLRSELTQLMGENFAQRTRILYGGSVKPQNARDLFERADIDGGLIGGASLKAEDFVGIIREGIRF